MTTITALNVRLGMDVSNFSDGANLAKNEVTKVATIMRQSVPPAEKYKQELDLLNRAFNDAGRQSAQYANAVDFLTKKHQQGRYSAEEIAKAQQAAAKAAEAAAAAAKRQKEELARLAEVEKQRQAILEKGKALTQSVERAQESHNRRMREYRELLRAGAIDQETYRRAVERSGKTQQQATNASNGLLSSIKGMAAAYVGFQTITKSLNLAGQVEDATIAFEVLTGSAAEGQLLFEQIRKFAAESPVTFGNATQAAKTMMGFGVAAQDVQKNLQMLSDVTGGNNERFKMLSLAFSQMSAAGRLMGQDLLQMINAGFNPLQQISKTTGESLVELKKRMEDGGISSQEVRRAFEDATAAGGMFYGMTDRLAQTVSGKLNIALSDLEKKLAEAGAKMAPLVIQLLGLFESLQPWLEATVRLLGRVADGLGYMLARATDLLNSIATFSWDETETNKFLDRLEKRERDLATARQQAVLTEFKQKNAAVNEVARAEFKAQQESAAAKKKAIEEQEKAAKQAAKAEEKRIKDLEKARLKAIEDEKKQRARAEKEAEEQFGRDLENARKAAMDFFKQREEKNQKRREDIAAGPGTGMEAGSGEAAKFAADRINKGIAEAVLPKKEEPGWAELGHKTGELFKAQQQANEISREQTRVLFSILSETKENGFRRIR